MLMRTDPFRELNRSTRQVLGNNARAPSPGPPRCRAGDQFVVIGSAIRSVDDLSVTQPGSRSKPGANRTDSRAIRIEGPLPAPLT
ncbi:MAG: hypothetical protein JWR58_6991 [Pseudonocardia sp.]|jgi:hypothetical protein|nr:hypothetical protein [Pseudonocardia sp.]